MSLDSWENTYFIELSGSPLEDIVLKQGVRKQCESGSLLLDIGAEVNNLYYLLEGEISVTAMSRTGDEKNIFFVKSHMLYGEAHVFLQRRNMFRISTTKPSTVIMLSVKEARRLFAENEHFRGIFLSSLSQKAFAMSAEIASLASSPVEERIYNCLVDLKKHRKNEDDDFISVTQHEIAIMLGIHRMTVNRALLRLEEKGVLKRSRNRIFLLHALLE